MIFHKKRIFGLRFWLLFILSFFLIISDHKHFFLPKLKPFLQLATTPLEYAVALPEHTFNSVRNYFIMQHELIHDKKNWQDQNLVLQAKLQELNAVKQRNEELQSLLKTDPVKNDQDYLLAQVISFKSEGSAREILINRGSNAHIATGQAIVSADGVVGQIIQTTPINSHVILLSDPRSAIPATNERTHDNLMIVGTGDNEKLSLLNIPNNADIKVGDTLFSSGIGGHYPAGYPIGTVSNVHMNGSNIDKVDVRPAAHLNQLHLLLVVFVNDKDAT